MTENPWQRGDWMQTFTGRQFYPAAPHWDDIDVLDIAHSLSMQCRYGGHVDRFYSVAEHCVLMSLALADAGHSEQIQLEALLHDATEAYVVDVPRPLKAELHGYRAIEDRVALAIAQRFQLPIASHLGAPGMPDEPVYVMPAAVKDADNRILLDERAALMSATKHAWAVDNLEPLGVTIQEWPAATARDAYLVRLEELGIHEATSARRAVA